LNLMRYPNTATKYYFCSRVSSLCVDGKQSL